jgi:dienelactone hydrolase
MPAHAETLDQRIARLEPGFTIVRPPGEGPFPLVIMLHGCGGPRPFIRRMADVAVEAGAAALLADSFAHRRISRIGAYTTVCTGARLHGRERAGDLYAAYAYARAQGWVDRDRIIVMGWSHGGWTIADALALRSGAEMRRVTGLDDLPDEPLEGLARAIMVYPYAGIGSYVDRRAWRIAPRALAIVAQRDYIVGDSSAALRRQQARNASLDIVVYERATHAFEDAEARDPRIRFSAEATAREQEMLREMIAGL